MDEDEERLQLFVSLNEDDDCDTIERLGQRTKGAK